MSNDAITINCMQELKNGFHRLGALLQSRTSQRFNVWYNAPVESLVAMDDVRSRSTGNMSDMLNLGLTRGAAPVLSLAIEYGYYAPLRGTRRCAFVQAAQNTDLVEATNFAYSILGARNRRSYSPAVASVVARAAFSKENRTKLERFVRILSGTDTELKGNHERIAWLLGNKLQDVKGYDGASSVGNRVYFTENSLFHYLAGHDSQQCGIAKLHRRWMLDAKPQ
jgi:hypothetical protein